MFDHHLTEFAGLPVFEYRMQGAEQDPSAVLAALRTPKAYAWRLSDDGGYGTSSEYEGIEEYFGRFSAESAAPEVAALVIGNFDALMGTDSRLVRDMLVAQAHRLTGVRSLFFADLTYEESEVSWLSHGDLGPLLTAFPSLERLAVRGTGDMALSVDGHPALRSLVLQGGGLPAVLARRVVAGDYPALEHLELWLGVSDYGGDTTPGDLAPVLDGKAHTGVRSLGLRNAEKTDVWVRALADAPLLDRLENLDLSMGTLTDEGARILLDAAGFRELNRLDLHHHYMTEGMEKRVLEAFSAAGVEIDASGREEPHDSSDEYEWRSRYYPSVTE